MRFVDRVHRQGLRPRLSGEPIEWHHRLAPYDDPVNPTSPTPARPVPALVTDLPDDLTVQAAVRIAGAVQAAPSAGPG